VNPTIIERKEHFARKMGGKMPRTVRSHDRLPPGQHLTTGFPVLDLGIQPEIPLSEWRLKVGGLVENPKTIVSLPGANTMCAGAVSRFSL
jgi:DMSO/TMAO reductase YedYZ molybdopterin-dependent catalytic subunit